MGNSPKCETEFMDKTPRPDMLQTAVDSLKRYWPMWLACALFLVMQKHVMVGWWMGWNKPYSYYSHGPLVPLIAIFMVWSLRKHIARTKVVPSWWGAALILPSIPIFVFGRWTGSGILCGFTFMTFLIGGLLLFLGPRMTRLLLFPTLFLIAMIPAPATVLDNATLKIQIESTSIATKMLSLAYPVTQHGAEIHSPDLPEPLIVGTPCSGFRLLISLLTFTAFFVYMIQAPGWKKTVLVAITFPLSLFINSLRISMIGLAGFWTGSADAMHKFHDWSGYIGLVVCFVILFGFARLIKAEKFGIPDPPEIPEGADPGGTPSHGMVGKGGRGAVAIALLLAVVLLNVFVAPLEATAKGILTRANIPKSFGDWTSEEVPVGKMVSRELKTADIMSRVYTNYNLDGRQVEIFVEAAKDTDAFHDPHSCLPGNGIPIADDRIITLKFDKPRKVTVQATALQSSGQFGANLVLYWYMSGPESCATTSEVRRKLRALQVKDLYNLATHPGDRKEIRKKINDRQWYWYRISTDVWQDMDTDLEVLKKFVYAFMADSKDFGQQSWWK